MVKVVRQVQCGGDETHLEIGKKLAGFTFPSVTILANLATAKWIPRWFLPQFVGEIGENE